MSQRATPEREQEKPPQFYDKVNARADRITTRFIIGFFVLGLLLSPVYGTYWIALLMGGGSLASYLIIRMLMRGSVLPGMVASFLFWNFGLQFLLQTQGIPEVTFIFFFGMAVLLCYEDWRVHIPATLYALGTVLVLYLSRDGELVKGSLPLMREISFLSVITNALAISAFAVLCMWWASQRRRQTRKSAEAARQMERQLGMVDVNIAFADHISRGNLKAVYGADHPDELGKSLVNMRESLIGAADREEREKFVNVGMARIGEILRLHAENVETLCDKVLEEIVRYMKANQGCIFVIENQDTPDEHLRLVAARAWERKKYLQKTVAVGDGLVGQAAVEKHTIFMTKVPDQYITITSGLGDANPNCILIVPLKSEEVVVGVIELASFAVYHDYEITFLEKVGESIASTIITTRNNQKNKELLEQSNVLTEQMRAQEEEMRQNLEEMQATQEEMARKNKEIERLLSVSDEKEAQLQRQLQEIRDMKKENDRSNEEMLASMNNYKQTLLNILDQLPHKIFLKDGQGRMVLVNTVVAKAHHMTIDELIGKSDFDFVDAETAQQWRNQEIEIIKKGSETYVFNDTIGGETKTLKSTKMAFFIPHLNEVGLLGIQTDITELERLRTQAEEAKRTG